MTRLSSASGVEEAGLEIEEEGMGDGYAHLLARKRGDSG